MTNNKPLTPAQIKRKIDQLVTKENTQSKLIKQLKTIKEEIHNLKRELNNAFRPMATSTTSKEGGTEK